MKKFVRLAIAIIAFVAFMAACGDDSDKKSKQDNVVPTTTVARSGQPVVSTTNRPSTTTAPASQASSTTSSVPASGTTVSGFPMTAGEVPGYLSVPSVSLRNITVIGQNTSGWQVTATNDVIVKVPSGVCVDGIGFGDTTVTGGTFENKSAQYAGRIRTTSVVSISLQRDMQLSIYRTAC